MRAVHALLPTTLLIAAADTTEPPAQPEWTIAEMRGIEVSGEIGSVSPNGEWLAGTGP